MPRQWEKTMAEQLRVPGHGLLFEGRVANGWSFGTGPGRARCSCGKRSPDLPSTAARQRWHRQHKRAVLDEQEAVVGTEAAGGGS